MANTLHILNGDSTLELFKQTQIEGETFVWREVLAEGPVHPNFNSDEFWNERRAFMTGFFTVKPEAYDQDVYLPFQALNKKVKAYEEIVLWFEYDLFCQINMVALIHWLEEIREPAQTISLVCSGKMDDSGQLYGLGELQAQQLEELYQKKLKLNTREFDFASDIYRAYTSTEVEDLYTYAIMPSDEFWYLADALQSHFKRFPYADSGLTEIEQKIIELAGESDNGNQLVGKLLNWQKFYGFGDLQYFNVLDSLEPLFEDFEGLKIKTEPELSSAIQNLNRKVKLGGAYLSEWKFDPSTEELVKVTS